MRIITTADDFGWSEETVRATVECFEQGGLTSASIMANMPATMQAIEYARQRTELSFGAHLTFIGGSGERPTAEASQIPHLVDPHGDFLPGRTVFIRAMMGRIPVDEIEREMTAQIAFLADHGVQLTHVDSHGHSHKLRPFVAALRRVLPRFGIRRVRRGQNVWASRPLMSPTYWVGGAWHPRISESFLTTDAFFMPTSELDAHSLGRVVSLKDRGTLEIGIHPGYSESWRDAERRAVQALGAGVLGPGHELIGWNSL